jgi:hypothetical protein
LAGTGSSSSSSDGGLEAIVAAAKQRKASGQAAGDEFSIDLSKLSLEQLERLREKAREKQWEDEWWASYVKQETDKKEAQDKESKQKDKQTISQYNITLTRYLYCWARTAGHVPLGLHCSVTTMDLWARPAAALDGLAAATKARTFVAGQGSWSVLLWAAPALLMPGYWACLLPTVGTKAAGIGKVPGRVGGGTVGQHVRTRSSGGRTPPDMQLTGLMCVHVDVCHVVAAQTTRGAAQNKAATAATAADWQLQRRQHHSSKASTRSITQTSKCLVEWDAPQQ